MNDLEYEKARAEFSVLGLANDKRKFALEIGFIGGQSFQDALERAQLKFWIRLIDVSPISEYPGKLFRIFKLTAAGIERLTVLKNLVGDSH